MNTEQAKKLSEDALTRLMEALERGRSEALKAYLAVMSRFHKYSWGNCLLIYSQRPDATHVGGFHFWLKLGRHVRKGEKGIAILAPLVGKKRSDDELTEDDQTRIFGFRVAHVFDLSQTDGEPLAEFATVHGDPREYTKRLEAFVAANGIALEYSDEIAPAHGMSSGGKITLLPSLSLAERFSVLVHETAHERLHRTDRRSQTTHTIRETEAEAVAFVVSSAIGLDVNTASADYIQLHSGDKATLAESLAFVQQTAAELLKAIMPKDTAASHQL
ncbi:MAG TPA: ArdC family protein [Bryobacteraceae bacterium]|nr:ArdC family protein [Bryobacteraceae bacterium]